jgi:NADPH2:quinone reductase
VRAFVFNSIGDRGGLADVPAPQPADGEILIQVNAVALVASDWRVRAGSRVGRQEHHFPAILGFDFAGQVVETPDGSDDWAAGDRLYGMAHKPYIGAGSLAELVTMPADGPMAPIPDFLTDVEAAALVSGWLTSLAALDEVTVELGDIVALTGASGGVGSVLTQLLARRGAEVVAVARTANRDYVEWLGAAHVVCRDQVDVVAGLLSKWPGGVDTLVDLVGDAARFDELVGAVRDGGQASSAVAAADPERLAGRDLRLSNVRTKPSAERLLRLEEEWVQEDLALPEIEVLAFADTAAAIDRLERGQGRGKLVVTVP